MTGTLTEYATISVERLQAVVDRAGTAEHDRDGAYTERTRLVAFLATLWPAQVVPSGDYWILYIDSPAGQLSWHIHPRDVHLLAGIPLAAAVEWDGHTTDEKYDRLVTLHSWGSSLAEGFAARVDELMPGYTQIMASTMHHDGTESKEAPAIHAYYEGVYDSAAAVRGEVAGAFVPFGTSVFDFDISDL